MDIRPLNIEEIFPIAHKHDLLIKQSDSFVNKAIAAGNIKAGYENMPAKLYSELAETPLAIKSPPQFLMGTYVKNHWRIILSSIIIGGVLVYIAVKSNQKKTTRKKVIRINQNY